MPHSLALPWCEHGEILLLVDSHSVKPDPLMRSILKWAGRIVIGLVVLILIAGGVLYMLGSSNAKKTYTVETAGLTIPTDSASIAHGKHLSEINGCVDCHGADLSGQVFADAPPFLISAANLTPGQGGLGRVYDADDFDRAIRHGIKKNGKPVFIMPSRAFHRLSDGDAAALIAYLQTRPPVDKELPESHLRFMGTMLAGTALDLEFEIGTDPARSEPAPPIGATAEYGEYVAGITCTYCHGENLQGLESPPNPNSPPAPSLAGAAQWPLDEFVRTLRTGVKPNGDTLQVEFMPYKITQKMYDEELEALHLHLAAVTEGS